MKKKILFIMPTFNSAGAERVTSNIINNIDRERFNVELMIVKEGEYEFLKNIKSDVLIRKLNCKKSLKFSLISIFKEILDSNPQTIFIGTGHLAVLLSPFVPFFSKYKWIVRETNFVSSNAKNGFVKFIYRYFFSNFDIVIAQCEDMKNNLCKKFGINDKKVTVINNPVDTDYIDRQINDYEEVVFTDKINLVACGRLTWQKGFENLILDFSKFKKLNNYHLTIIGKGEGDERDTTDLLKRLVIDYNLSDHVTFLGHKNNVYPWLMSADLFILSSLFEGFPNILLETIYCGCPVISNDCPGGIKDIILDGYNGLVYKSGVNLECMVLRAEEIDRTNKSNFSNYIRNKFGVRKIIKEYEDIL